MLAVMGDADLYRKAAANTACAATMDDPDARRRCLRLAAQLTKLADRMEYRVNLS